MFLVSILAAISVTAVGQPQPPNVALIYSDYGNFRHRDDYDARFRELKWPLTKLENKDIAQWIGRLGEYDLVLGSALFNYSNVQDFGQYRDQWLKFMADGGGLVLTDCSYLPHVNWLKALGEGWEMDCERCGKVGTPMKWIEAAHPLFNVPHHIARVKDTWSHLLPGDGYDVLTKCEDDHATTALRSHGKGFLLATNYWAYGPELCENIWAFLQAHRGGLVPALADISGCHLGENEVRLGLWNVTERPVDARVQLEIKRPDGRTERRLEQAHVPAHAARDVPLRLKLEQRGEYEFIVSVLDRTGQSRYQTPPARLHIPDLMQMALVAPQYRGAVYQMAPASKAVASIVLTPWKEKLQDLSLSLSLRRAGRTLAAKQLDGLPGEQFDLTLPLPGLEAGEYSLVGVLKARGRVVARREIKLPVHPRRPNQVVIDQRGATWVNGELYFPVGIYHVHREDLPKIVELGFNCCQAWGTREEKARNFLDEAQRLGVKVILEMSSFLRGKTDLEGMRKIVTAFEEHPALLTWYTVDEPRGPMLTGCRAAYTMIREIEPDHPVYLVMCSPGEFDRFGAVTDILAVDPYPIPHSSVNRVADWMKRAQAAVRGRRPVWMIPQAHNQLAYRDKTKGRGPTPVEERNMVYQGLIYGAKGIIYYPWDDGPCGLTHDPALMAAVKQINAELAQLGPRLLTYERKLLPADSLPESVHAASFTGKTEVLVLAANGRSERVTLRLPLAGATQAEVLFEGRKLAVEDGGLEDDFEPLAVHVYRVAR